MLSLYVCVCGGGESASQRKLWSFPKEASFPLGMGQINNPVTVSVQSFFFIDIVRNIVLSFCYKRTRWF